VVQRTRIASQIRWYLHELDPDLVILSRGLRRLCVVAELIVELDRFDGVVARLARNLLARCDELNHRINALEAELRGRRPRPRLCVRRVLGGWTMGESTHRVFLCYRREDAQHFAGRLADRLIDSFGAAQVFMDIDSLEMGVDFVTALEEEVGSCDVLLVVIGPHWVNVTDERGGRRLDDPEDFVVVEVRTGLQRNIMVVPLLVDGASMPHRHELPDELQPLTRRNAHRLWHESFRADADRLIRTLERVLPAVAARCVRRVRIGVWCRMTWRMPMTSTVVRGT
jgi:hypothetical protein